MSIELKVPEIGESITEVEIGSWLKKAGEPVKKDEPVVTLESEKATVELPSPDAGTMGKVLKQQGDTAKIGEVIAYLEEAKADGAEKKVEKAPETKAPEKAAPQKSEPKEKTPEVKAEEEPATPRPTQVRAAQDKPRSERLRETQDPEEVLATAERKTAPTPAAKPAPQRAGQETGVPGRQEEVVPMSKLRRTVAERLVEAQHNAALLTTFNEIDMSSVMALRKENGEAFQKKYNVKLGFMSFFVKAAIDGLKQFPAINSEVRGTDIVYHNYFDIGVAIGSGKGLVVPVLRNAERLSFAEIEMAIGDFGRRAQENKLKPDELQGGTFTITNGGVYGSLLSTPIVNPPQSGVLGMHGIQERPVAHEGQVVIRPMMYVALTYDHRIVDGREAVTFLKRVKDAIENPARMLIEI
ncbi:MAG TPA: 2-oxoglutarate dehydrogenase complex dihydrolipoyllysine-residue succinyltransferase [Verrucomicrobiae bacterium]|jgi:2-oxoglutarate dehydrogenase E2 component (dihydrolipoamide succinyltransferase)|nr:2-oxoglutarate dehydrogenase complex dihydrolipoyllysine-residue succinyltransferase [Verrucomicrobiae bacterium]